MVSVPFQRHRAWFENLALLLALCIVIAAALASFESLWFFFLEPFADAWLEFAWCLVRAFVAVAALVATLSLGSRLLPQRRVARWIALAAAILAAAAMGWFAEDGLTGLLSGAPISAGERPYMIHTMLVLA